MAGFEGRRREAMEILDELASYCDEHFGVFDRRSLTALEDFAYYALRAGHLDRALEARREMLHRRVQQSPEVGYVQTAPARTNLAFTLLEFNDDDLLPEAEQLITESLTLWSRAFGFDGKRAQRARLLRTRLWLRQGLALERNGDTVGASALFDQAASDTARVLELRRDAEPSSHAIALLRHGTARACQRERDALVSIGDAMDLRRDQLGQDASFWEMQRCAEILQWTYDRLGRHTEATSIRNRYHLPQGGDVTI
jgi:tetratricopeptide (TPR) repeat protein